MPTGAGASSRLVLEEHMSDASHPAAESVDPVPTTGAPYRVLRIWPVAVLLVLLWVLHLGPYFIDGLGMAGFMIAGFGPLVCGLLMGVWWVAASRAKWFERLWGVLGVIAVIAVASAVAHPTLRDFWIFMLGAPSAVTAFGLGMLLVHRWRSPARVPVALLFLAVTFGYWDLLRFDGMTGEYASELSWRWEPTREQRNASRHRHQRADRSRPGEVVGVPRSEPGRQGAGRRPRIRLEVPSSKDAVDQGRGAGMVVVCDPGEPAVHAGTAWGEGGDRRLGHGDRGHVLGR
jgi:hypothetical protein